MRHIHRSYLHRRLVVAYIGLLLVTVFTCSSAYADAPITRGEPTQAKGSMSASDHTWSGIQTLPPLAAGAAPTSTASQSWSQDIPEPDRPYSATEDTTSTAWLSRSLNPGNWIVDAGLGIGTSMFMTFIEIGMAVTNQLLGTEGCLGVAFCTPTDTLFGSSGVVSFSLASVWNRLQPAAIILITILATVRVGQTVYENPHGAGQSLQDLAWGFIFSLMFATGCGWVLYHVVEFFNGINAAILGQQDLQMLKSLLSPTPLSFGPAIMRFIMFMFLMAVIALGYVRLLRLFILATVAPLMGATLMNRGTAPYFWSWGGAIIVLLLEQTAWAVSFSIGQIIVFPFGLPDLSTPLGNTLASVGMSIALILTMMSRSVFKQIFAITPVGSGTIRNAAKQAVGWAAHGAMVGSRSRGSVGAAVGSATMRGGLFGGPVGAAGSAAGALIGAGFRRPPAPPTRRAGAKASGNSPRPSRQNSPTQQRPVAAAGATNTTGAAAGGATAGAAGAAGAGAAAGGFRLRSGLPLSSLGSSQRGATVGGVGQAQSQPSQAPAIGPTVRLPARAQPGAVKSYATVRLPNIAQPGQANSFVARRLSNPAQQPTTVASNTSRGASTPQGQLPAGSAARLPNMTQASGSKAYNTVRLPDLTSSGNTGRLSKGSKTPRTTTYGGEEIRLKPIGQRPRTWEPTAARVPDNRDDLRKPHVFKPKGVPAPEQMRRAAHRAVNTRPRAGTATTHGPAAMLPSARPGAANASPPASLPVAAPRTPPVRVAPQQSTDEEA